jgi:hypothetical protein
MHPKTDIPRARLGFLQMGNAGGAIIIITDIDNLYHKGHLTVIII